MKPNDVILLFCILAFCAGVFVGRVGITRAEAPVFFGGIILVGLFTIGAIVGIWLNKP